MRWLSKKIGLRSVGCRFA